MNIITSHFDNIFLLLISGGLSFKWHNSQIAITFFCTTINTKNRILRTVLKAILKPVLNRSGFALFLSTFLREMCPCDWTDWALWASTQYLRMFTASSCIRKGSSLGLIPDVLNWVQRVGFRELVREDLGWRVAWFIMKESSREGVH